MIIVNDTFSVYIHINKLNNKLYVGITKRQVEKRWNNGEGYVGSERFYNAIKKYGWENFDHEIFASNLNEDEAKNMENFLISKLNLQNNKYGYNIAPGGTDCSLAEETKIKIGNALRGKTFSEEKKQIYSEAHKGKRLSSEHTEAIRKSRSKIIRTEEWNNNIRKSWEKYKGENHPNFGMKLSEEHLKKMHDAGKIFQKEHRELWASVWKSVLCLETGVEFLCIEDAAKTYGICRSSISECASGKRKSAGGYHWKFIESLETSRKT